MAPKIANAGRILEKKMSESLQKYHIQIGADTTLELKVDVGEEKTSNDPPTSATSAPQ